MNYITTRTYYDEQTCKHLKDISHYYNKKFHCKDGEPSHIKYYEDGTIKERKWHIMGKFAREDGPSWEKFDKYGNCIMEKYYKKGKLHRDNEPAVIYRDSAANKKTEPKIRSEEWYQKGVRCNSDKLGPYVITYIYGQKYIEEFTITAETRSKIPKYKQYYRGNLAKEVWRDESNNIHRDDDKPAIISYYDNGNIKYEEWFVHNEMKGPDKLIKKHYNNEGHTIAEVWLLDKEDMKKEMPHIEIKKDKVYKLFRYFLHELVRAQYTVKLYHADWQN